VFRTTRRRITLLALVPAASMALVLAPAEAAHQKRIFVASNHCGEHVLRPSRISLECPHRTFSVKNLTYTSYGGRIARAKGLFSDTCGSSCGSSPFKQVPGSVTLKDVIRCQGRFYYGSISWHYNSADAGGNGGALIGPSPNCRDYWGG
jgi:hypothetical protein